MQQTDLVLFSYSSNSINLPFFKDFGFTSTISHKSLDFLFPFDDLDNHSQAVQCDILFLEENATVTDAVINTIENADNIYLIFNNESEHIKDRLQKISKGKIYRNILSKELEKDVCIALIEQMAQAYKNRDKGSYHDSLDQLKSLFTENVILEVKLQLLKASSNKDQIKTLLSTCKDTEKVILSKIIEKEAIKELLQTLSGNELTEIEALKKVRSKLYNEIC
ncbi:MAG: hypothetical protein CMO01_25625 [Thalassobius sp.]|nr:hypothetical protein [Thalassovita sp.]